MIQKSYTKSDCGTLYLIPTPIGNLGDITQRAIDTLKEVDIIFAEDTRVTGLLLSKLSIKKKLESCHKYTENKNKDQILDLLKDNKKIGFVSDRGTPLISDPGNYVANYVIENGYNVIALPGPSALLPAINMSGLDNDKFYFYGFLSSNKTEAKNELKDLNSFRNTIIFYESPHRIKATLTIMLEVFGNRKIAIAREISKVYEEVFRGNIEESLIYCDTIKGEIVIVVEGNNKISDDIDYISEVRKLINNGISKSSAVKEVSTLYGISKNKLYEECKEL